MFYNTVKQYLAGLGAMNDKAALTPLLSAMADRFSSQATSTAGLVISATTTTSKIGAVAFAGVANGVPVALAAAIDMPALTGLNIAAGAFNVFCYFIDAAGVVTVQMGSEGATLGAVRFPQFPVGKALVGYLVVTYASPFVGGTTVLSTATTVYVSPVGAFDPTIILG
jgi:hypothetical protein